MDTKSLLIGIVSFIAGGLLVSIVATADPSRHTMGAEGALQDVRGEEFDRAFLSEMILHHQGAIEMAKQAKERAAHDEIKKISDDIITAQEKEISTMRQWQNNWGMTTYH